MGGRRAVVITHADLMEPDSAAPESAAPDECGRRRFGGFKRLSLLLSAALGTIVTLVGVSVTGVIAPATDQATTQPNGAGTGAVAVATVGLQLAPSDGASCGPFSDDLSSGLHAASNLQPEDGSGVGTTTASFCIKNVGTAPATVAVSALELSDVELDCTGDEATLDATCGGGGPGELGPHLSVEFLSVACDVTPGGWASPRVALTSLAGAPIQIGPGPFPPGGVGCFQARVTYQPASPDAATAAQSDQTTWKYAFDGAQS